MDRARFKIITDHGDRDTFAPYRHRVPASVGRGLRTGLRVGWELWRASLGMDGTHVLVTYGSVGGFVLALLQSVASVVRRPRTHLMFDLLYERKRTGIRGLWDRVKRFAFNRAEVHAVVWGLDDREGASREFNAPRHRFHPHPYHKTLDGYDFDVCDEGYLFAGGNVGRDYRTIIEAVRTLDIPVRIATTDDTVAALAVGLSHVQVEGVSPAQFRRKMAECSIVVEAHPVDYVRTAGHQTMLNAMHMGKAVIVADRRSAEGYISDGVNGLVVDAGDVEALRAKILQLWEDRAWASQIGEAGRCRVNHPLFETLGHVESIYDLALALDHARWNREGWPPRVELYLSSRCPENDETQGERGTQNDR